MNRSKTRAMISLATLGLLISTASMAHPWFSDVAPQSSVDMCVAEIADHADYSQAARVRHEVESEHRRTVGHILRIDTRVYGQSDGKLVREYTTKCIVGVGLEPVRFVIRETADAS